MNLVGCVELKTFSLENRILVIVKNFTRTVFSVSLKILKIIALIALIIVVSFNGLIYGWRALDKLHRINQEKSIVSLIGEECKKKAVLFGDGYEFAVCDNGEGDIEGASFIVYDSSDQIELPSERRSDLWRYMFLNYPFSWSAYRQEVTKIEGHFYELVTGVSWGADPIMYDFAKRYNCRRKDFDPNDLPKEIVICEKFNPSSK